MNSRNSRGRGRDESGRLLRKDGQLDRRSPPKEHQFKPGQSGYPKGRPKGAKSTDTILRNILDRKIDLRVNGTSRKISVREAILTRFAEDALKGNPKSATFLLNRYDTSNKAEVRDSAVDEGDQEIIDAFAERLLQAQRKSRP